MHISFCFFLRKGLLNCGPLMAFLWFKSKLAFIPIAPFLKGKGGADGYVDKGSEGRSEKVAS